jgi:magnesium-transporting ATPase (P-type)
MSDTNNNNSGAANGPLASIQALGQNPIFPKLLVVLGILLAIFCFLVTAFETVVFFTFCGYYSDFNKEIQPLADLKNSFAGEFFFLTLVVIGSGLLSFVTMIFCCVVLFGTNNKNMAKSLCFWVCIIINSLALAVVVVQSANYGGEMRIINDSYGSLCTTARSKAACGFIASYKAVFAGCMGLIASVVVNFAFTIVVYMIKGGI